MNESANIPAPIREEPGTLLPHLLIIALTGVLLWQTWHYYPLLPETVASHFDGAGRPNGFQSRGFFFGLMWAIVLLMALAFVGIPRAIARINPRLLNIPNKDYWLLAGRVETLRLILNREMGWYGVAVIGFIVYVMQLVLDANVARTPLNNTLMWTGLGGFLALTIGWIVRFYRVLAVPKPERRATV